MSKFPEWNHLPCPHRSLSSHASLAARAASRCGSPSPPWVLAGCNDQRPYQDGIPTFGAQPGATTSSHSVFDLWQGFSVGAMAVGFLTTFLIIWAVIRYAVRATTSQAEPVPPAPGVHLHHHPRAHRSRALRRHAGCREQRGREPQDRRHHQRGRLPVGLEVHVIRAKTCGGRPDDQDPEMVMPVNENVHINLTSSDVIHGFYIHAFNFSRYALPGVLNSSRSSSKLGTYDGQCTQPVASITR